MNGIGVVLLVLACFAQTLPQRTARETPNLHRTDGTITIGLGAAVLGIWDEWTGNARLNFSAPECRNIAGCRFQMVEELSCMPMFRLSQRTIISFSIIWWNRQEGRKLSTWLKKLTEKI